jgi:hypothetical protein
MSKITLDLNWQARFNGLKEPLEVCDEAGKMLGHFLPEAVYRRFLQAWADSQISDAEIAQLRQQSGGRSLTEIWKSLGRS